MVNDCRSIFIRSEDRLADEHAQYPTRRRKMNRNHVHDGKLMLPTVSRLQIPFEEKC